MKETQSIIFIMLQTQKQRITIDSGLPWRTDEEKSRCRRWENLQTPKILIFQKTAQED